MTSAGAVISVEFFESDEDENTLCRAAKAVRTATRMAASAREVIIHGFWLLELRNRGLCELGKGSSRGSSSFSSAMGTVRYSSLGAILRPGPRGNFGRGIEVENRPNS